VLEEPVAVRVGHGRLAAGCVVGVANWSAPRAQSVTTSTKEVPCFRMAVRQASTAMVATADYLLRVMLAMLRTGEAWRYPPAA